MPRLNTNLDQKPKTALLAASGGLDSICLLHALSADLTDQDTTHTNKINLLVQKFCKENKLSKIELAYIDHSQRNDTDSDIKTIRTLANSFKLKLHVKKLDLPSGVSESAARNARYKALNEIKDIRKLDHIITAHHADDVLETAIINLTRGTGPKGLCSLQHQPNGLWRPLISELQKKVIVTKADLLDYAKLKSLTWHEDSTNSSDLYLRNRIRDILKKSDDIAANELLNLIISTSKITQELDKELVQLDKFLVVNDDYTQDYDKTKFTSLPTDIQKQFIHFKLSKIGYDVNRDSVTRAREFIQSATTGKTLQLKGCDITIPKKDAFRFAPARQNAIIST